MQKCKFSGCIKTFAKTSWDWFKGFLLLFAGECVEELLEEAIASGISGAIAVLFGTTISRVLVIFGIVQVSKVLLKQIIKVIIIILKPLIKKITYKEGNDKVETIKNLARRLKMDEEKKNKVKENFMKFVNYMKRNVKSNTATITNVIASGGVGTLFGGGLAVGHVDLPVWAYVILGILVTAVTFFLIELGVIAPGYENQPQYDARVEKEKEVKLIKAEEKAKAEEEAKLKKAAEEADKKAKEKLLADQKAAEEKKAQEQLDAKITAIKNEYQVAVNNGTFTGTLTDWINRK